ncbi:MAG TPA: hypothetical protein VH478_01010 [Trebonia sp.]|nr:hypothetical protein [Trebonia sp.]
MAAGPSTASQPWLTSTSTPEVAMTCDSTAGGCGGTAAARAAGAVATTIAPMAMVTAARAATARGPAVALAARGWGMVVSFLVAGGPSTRCHRK